MTIQILPISAADDAQIARIIRQVGAEYGAVGEGFGPGDAEVSAMSQHYLAEHGACYFVAKQGEQVLGGAGIAAFANASGTRTCELRKLFLLAESRGLGLGRALSLRCLEFAQQQGYQQCYLDTLKTMQAAIKLYQSLGFVELSAPMGESIHSGCDVWMLKQL